MCLNRPSGLGDPGDPLELNLHAAASNGSATQMHVGTDAELDDLALSTWSNAAERGSPPRLAGADRRGEGSAIPGPWGILRGLAQGSGAMSLAKRSAVFGPSRPDLVVTLDLRRPM